MRNSNSQGMFTSLKFERQSEKLCDQPERAADRHSTISHPLNRSFE